MVQRQNELTLYEYIQYQSAMQGLSLNQLAAQLKGKLTAPTLYNLKHNKPRPKTYAILAQELNLSITELIDLPIHRS